MRENMSNPSLFPNTVFLINLHFSKYEKNTRNREFSGKNIEICAHWLLLANRENLLFRFALGETIEYEEKFL